MATAHDLISRAFREIGVLAQGETAAAQEATDALAKLNSMIAGWKRRSVDLDIAPLSLTTTFALPVDAPIGADEAVEAVVWNLAARLAPEYGRPAQMVQMEAARSFAFLQAAYQRVPESEAEPMFTYVRTRLGSWWGR
jgi:hypothetical protein